MPHRHGRFPVLGYVMQTGYDVLSLARLATDPIAALDPGVGPTQSSIRMADCASLCELWVPSPELGHKRQEMTVFNLGFYGLPDRT